MYAGLQYINLSQIRDEYLGLSEYLSMVETLVSDVGSGRRKRNLGDLFRHHSQRAVTGADTWWRDGLDYHLSMCGIIEIGIWTGDLPPDLPRELSECVRPVLEHQAVIQYSEVYYPVALPSLLRERLRGRPKIQAGSIHDPGRFALFLEVTRPIEHDSDIETFLWYLDDGWRGWSIDDTKKVLSSRERFLRAMASRPGKRSELQRSVVGFAKFLTFCRSFESLLDGTDDHPLLRAGFWYHHAYWFAHAAARLQRQMESGIDCFARWKGAELSAEVAAQTMLSCDALGGPDVYEADRRRMHDTIARLTSGEFGTSLNEHLDSMLLARLKTGSEKQIPSSL